MKMDVMRRQKRMRRTDRMNMQMSMMMMLTMMVMMMMDNEMNTSPLRKFLTTGITERLRFPIRNDVCAFACYSGTIFTPK